MKSSLVLLLVFAVSVYGAVDDNRYSKYDKYRDHELTAQEQQEVAVMQLDDVGQDLLDNVNLNSYFIFNNYLDKLDDTLRSFALFFDDDTDVKHFDKLVNQKWSVDYVILSASKKIEFALDYVKAKLTQDSYDETQKEKFEIIQKDLTEAKKNVDFLGEQINVCLEKFASVSEKDIEAKEKALFELKNHGLAKPFLHLIKHARDQNEQINDYFYN